jgi:hypothetical protein
MDTTRTSEGPLELKFKQHTQYIKNKLMKKLCKQKRPAPFYPQTHYETELMQSFATVHVVRHRLPTPAVHIRSPFKWAKWVRFSQKTSVTLLIGGNKLRHIQ